MSIVIDDMMAEDEARRKAAEKAKEDTVVTEQTDPVTEPEPAKDLV